MAMAATLVIAQTPGGYARPAVFGTPSDAPPQVPQVPQTPPQAPANIASNYPRMPEVQPVQSPPAVALPPSGGERVKGPEQPLPPIAVKGRLIMQGREPIALLEVGGQIIPVQKGMAVTVAQNIPLRIVQISSTEVAVEAGADRRPLVLR
jgi:hypothetical protein